MARYYKNTSNGITVIGNNDPYILRKLPRKKKLFINNKNPKKDKRVYTLGKLKNNEYYK